jgi:hypothetical protein
LEQKLKLQKSAKFTKMQKMEEKVQNNEVEEE